MRSLRVFLGVLIVLGMLDMYVGLRLSVAMGMSFGSPREPATEASFVGIDGKPAKGIKIVAENDGGSALTDDKGRVPLEKFKGARYVMAQVEGRGVRVRWSDRHWDAYVLPTGQAAAHEKSEVRVMLADGRPLSGVFVELKQIHWSKPSHGSEWGKEMAFETDADGVAVVDLRVAIEKGKKSIWNEKVRNELLVNRISVRLEPSTELQYLPVDIEAALGKRVEVKLTANPPRKFKFTRGPGNAMTDEQVSQVQLRDFENKDWPASRPYRMADGTYKLSWNGWGRTVVIDQKTPKDEVAVDFGPTVMVKGNVLDALTLKPVAGALVMLDKGDRAPMRPSKEGWETLLKTRGKAYPIEPVPYDVGGKNAVLPASIAWTGADGRYEIPWYADSTENYVFSAYLFQPGCLVVSAGCDMQGNSNTLLLMKSAHLTLTASGQKPEPKAEGEREPLIPLGIVFADNPKMHKVLRGVAMKSYGYEKPYKDVWGLSSGSLSQLKFNTPATQEVPAGMAFHVELIYEGKEFKSELMTLEPGAHKELVINVKGRDPRSVMIELSDRRGKYAGVSARLIDSEGKEVARGVAEDSGTLEVVLPEGISPEKLRLALELPGKTGGLGAGEPSVLRKTSSERKWETYPRLEVMNFGLDTELQLVDESQAPIPWAVIRATGWLGNAEVKANAEGKFKTNALRKTLPYWVTVEVKGRGVFGTREPSIYNSEWSMSVARVAGVDGPKPMVMRGRVLDVEGKGIEDCLAIAVLARKSYNGWVHVERVKHGSVTGPDGRFEVVFPQPDKYDREVYGSDEYRLVVLPRPGQGFGPAVTVMQADKDATVVLPRARPMEVRTDDSQMEYGKPKAYWSEPIAWVDEASKTILRLGDVSSGAGPRELSDGKYLIGGKLVKVDAGDKRVDFGEFAQGKRVRLKILHAETGSPMKGVFVFQAATSSNPGSWSDETWEAIKGMPGTAMPGPVVRAIQKQPEQEYAPRYTQEGVTDENGVYEFTTRELHNDRARVVAAAKGFCPMDLTEAVDAALQDETGVAYVGPVKLMPGGRARLAMPQAGDGGAIKATVYLRALNLTLEESLAPQIERKLNRIYLPTVMSREKQTIILPLNRDVGFFGRNEDGWGRIALISGTVWLMGPREVIRVTSWEPMDWPLEFAAFMRCQVRVVTPDGKPAANAWIASGLPGFIDDEGWYTVDAKGEFSLTLPRGRKMMFGLKIGDRYYRSNEIQVPVESENATADLTVVSEGQGTVRGPAGVEAR
jgi:hypothetical protein